MSTACLKSLSSLLPLTQKRRMRGDEHRACLPVSLSATRTHDSNEGRRTLCLPPLSRSLPPAPKSRTTGDEWVLVSSSRFFSTPANNTDDVRRAGARLLVSFLLPPHHSTSPSPPTGVSIPRTTRMRHANRRRAKNARLLLSPILPPTLAPL